MNILFDNVDWNSTAGPHWFGRKLASHLNQNGHGINTGNDDVQLSIVMASQKREGLPLIQRLDGIYYDTAKDYAQMNYLIQRLDGKYDTAKDYVEMNSPIKATYDVADGVVFQSEWSKKLVESQFGPAKKYAIINNGTDIDVIQSIPPATGLDGCDKVWSCASSWFYEDGTQRYIKRLEENIRYFQEHSGENDILCIAGDVRDFKNPDDDKIVFLGELGLTELFSVYRRSDYFLHLGRFDNCPNVVVDARAAGCHIICSSLGGTIEVAGKDATVIKEDEWDFVPFDCNVPSALDFSRKMDNTYEKDISMDFVSDRYLGFFGECCV